jgi:hypothetical protein
MSEGTWRLRITQTHATPGHVGCDHPAPGTPNRVLVRRPCSTRLRTSGPAGGVPSPGKVDTVLTGVDVRTASDSAAVADFNGDGWPDLFIARHWHPANLWLNNHDGTFSAADAAYFAKIVDRRAGAVAAAVALVPAAGTAYGGQSQAPGAGAASARSADDDRALRHPAVLAHGDIPRGRVGVTDVNDAVVTLLAGRAHQPVQSVPRPPGDGCPGPVVSLPERGRIRECHPASWHIAPGGRDPDLITNDTALGDRNRVDQRVEACRNQRVEARRRPCDFTVVVKPGADGTRLTHPGGPAGRAGSPRVPGNGS